MSHHVVEVKDLRFSYERGSEVLKGVSFRISHGKSVGLVGGNGAGKSTLLLHLNGCLLPQSGEIRIGDSIVSSSKLAEVRKAVGLVFQDPDDQLFMPTALDDVAFGPRNSGMSHAEAEKTALDALEVVGMKHVAARPPYKLSMGEKRAVAIATVLAMKPDILVMDEPTSNLDPRHRRQLIRMLNSFEHTKIIASHDLEFVVETCQDVIVLDGGAIVASGPAAEILDNEALMLAHGLERPHILRHQHPHARGTC